MSPKRRRRGSSRRGLYGGGPVLFLAVLVVAIVVAGVAWTAFRTATTSGEEVGQRVPTEPATHVPDGSALSYRSFPPASGMHYPRPLEAGVYEEEISPGYWVHNLEHGYVVIAYRCPDGCPEVVDELRGVYEQAPETRYGYQKLIVVPYSEMDSRLVALAWGWRLELEEPDSDRLLDFYRAHVGRGPEDAP